MNEDEFERSGYEGENLNDEHGILCFIEGFEVPRAWMILDAKC
jgi:hypothetical protein